MTTCPHCGEPVAPADQNCRSCGRGLSGKDLLANANRDGMPTGAAIMIAVSLLIAFFGLLSLSEATLGVGVMAFACLLAIFGRMMQAQAHFNKR